MFHALPRRFALLVLVLTALSFAGQAAAQSRPHAATGAAQFVNAENDFIGSGHATHLGKYTEVGRVSFAPAGPPGVFIVTGWTRYEAANGDQLFGVIDGMVDMGTGAVTATVTYVGGTGRFADASGSSALIARLLAGGALEVAVAGRIAY